MDNLYIEATQCTLKVDFNASNGILEFEGDSYPENPFEFFQTIIGWLEAYFSEHPEEVKVILKLHYLSTSSTKCVFELLEVFDSYHNQGGNIYLQWYYNEDDDDEDILELGEELVEDFKVPVSIVSY